MSKWMVAAKRADFEGIGKKYQIRSGQGSGNFAAKDCGEKTDTDYRGL